MKIVKRIGIIVPGFLPVPSVEGGAIETLITGLLEINEKKKLLDISVFSPYNRILNIRSFKIHNYSFCVDKIYCGQQSYQYYNSIYF